MKVFVKLSSLMLTILSSLLLTSCGYHLRSWHDWPAEIGSLAINSQDVPANVSYYFTMFIKSMHVHNNPESPYKLLLSDYHYTQSQPASVNTSVASTITYSMSITFKIDYQGKSCIPSTTISSSLSQLEPSNPLATQASDPDMQQRVLDDVVQSFYDKMNSNATKQALVQNNCN